MGRSQALQNALRISSPTDQTEPAQPTRARLAIITKFCISQSARGVQFRRATQVKSFGT